MENLINQIGLPLIALLVPMLVALFKSKAMPHIPSFWLPLIATFLGALGEFAIAKITGTGMTGWQGALMGLAGVGVREIVDQIKKAITEA